MSGPAPAEGRDAMAELEAAFERLVADRSIPSWTRAWWSAFYGAMPAPTLEDVRQVVARLEEARERARGIAA